MNHNNSISVDQFLQSDAQHLAGKRLACPFCGQGHSVPINEIRSGAGIINNIPGIASRIIGRHDLNPVVIYDQAIEPFIQENILKRFQDMKFPVRPMALGQPGLLLESEDRIGNEAADSLGSSVDLLIAAGSGVICDLTKWIATRLNKPFILCGTAPSMNGYTSITATITENEIKKSELLNPANAVVADADILSKAPMAMIHAGMEDLTARAVCNADWKLSSLLRNTYFCPLPYRMTGRAERAYLGVAERIGRSDPGAISVLSEAILVSGLSMTILGDNTSPSSGGEHIISHFWDLLVHLRGAPKNLHGAQVGIGTVLMLALYEIVRRHDISKIDPIQLLRRRPSMKQIDIENKLLYGEKSVDFTRVAAQKRVPDQDYVEYIKGIRANWESLWSSLDPYIAPLNSIIQPLKTAGVNLKLESIHRTRAEGIEALLNGSRYRPRYSMLDLAWELGIFPDAAEQVLELAGVL